MNTLEITDTTPIGPSALSGEELSHDTIGAGWEFDDDGDVLFVRTYVEVSDAAFTSHGNCPEDFYMDTARQGVELRVEFDFVLGGDGFAYHNPQLIIDQDWRNDLGFRTRYVCGLKRDLSCEEAMSLLQKPSHEAMSAYATYVAQVWSMTNDTTYCDPNVCLSGDIPRDEYMARVLVRADYQAHAGRTLWVRRALSWDGEGNHVEVLFDSPVAFVVNSAQQVDDIFRGNSTVYDPYWDIAPLFPDDPKLAAYDKNSFMLDGPSRGMTNPSDDYLYSSEWIRMKDTEFGILDFDGAYPDSQTAFEAHGGYTADTKIVIG